MLLIVGDVFANRVNPRMMLFVISAAAVAVSLLLVPFLNGLQLYMLVAFGTTIALLNTLGSPVRQALVN